MHFDSVLIVSFGGPQGLADIRPFLANVLRGRRVSPERVEEVAHHYELFGGVSPITELTRRQADGLQQRLAAAGHPLPVHVGMRNWHPLLPDTLREMMRRAAPRDRVHRRGAALVLELPAVPRERRRGARRSCGASGQRRRRDLRRQLVRSSAVCRGQRGARARGARAAARRCAAARGWSSPRTAFRRRWPSGRGIASSWRLGAARRDASRHQRLGARVSEPQRAARGSLARARRLRLPARERATGCEAAVLCPIGFVCDHIEVLYDLDREAAGGVPRDRAARWRARRR